MHEFSVAFITCLCSVTGYIAFRISCHLRVQADFDKCDVRNSTSCMANIFHDDRFNSNSAAEVIDLDPNVFS